MAKNRKRPSVFAEGREIGYISVAGDQTPNLKVSKTFPI
jgi:hypothetical protein